MFLRGIELKSMCMVVSVQCEFKVAWEGVPETNWGMNRVDLIELKDCLPYFGATQCVKWKKEMKDAILAFWRS